MSRLVHLRDYEHDRPVKDRPDTGCHVIPFPGERRREDDRHFAEPEPDHWR